MLVLCFKAELSKSLFPFLAIAKQLLEAGLCVQKRFMYSDVSSLLSQLPTALHALVFKVGLWALGHQLSAVLLCWQHGPCWEMWSVSALRPELGALREHTVQSPVVPPRSYLPGLVGAIGIWYLIVWALSRITGLFTQFLHKLPL